MATLSPPPYQDAADSSTWMSWYRQINDLLSGVSTSINNIDDVEVVGATQGDLLFWNATAGEWQNTESPTIPGNLDVEGTLTVVGAVTYSGDLTLDEEADAAAEAGPIVTLRRDSASPAVDDQMGQLEFYGDDSGGNDTRYGYIVMDLHDPTDTNEQGHMDFYVREDGAEVRVLSLGGDADEHGIDVVGGIDVTHTATHDDDHAMAMTVDTAGFGGVLGLDIDYIAGALGATDQDTAILVNIDDTATTEGELIGLEVVSTAGAADKITALFVGATVAPLEHLSGIFIDPAYFDNNGADATTAVSSGGGGSVTIFSADNNYIIVEATTIFEEISFDLTTGASGAGVAPTFEYSTGAGTWASFVPTDGTNAFRNSGVVVWDDALLPGFAVGATGRFMIRITRTRNSLTTVPVVNQVRTAATAEFYWNKNADIYAETLQLRSTLDVEGVLTAPGGITLADAVIQDVESIHVGDEAHDMTISGTVTEFLIGAHAAGVTDLGEVLSERHSDTAGFGGHIVVARSRGTEASKTVVQSGDVLGRLEAVGYDGTDYVRAAAIRFHVDATPSAEDMPGRITFYTTADGAATPTERLRISQDGTVKVVGALDAEGVATFASSPVFQASIDAEAGITVPAAQTVDIESEVTLDGVATNLITTTDEDVLTWNDASEIWEPQAAAGGGGWTYGTQTATTSGTSVTLADDVNFSSATEVEILFNGVSTNTNNAAPIVRIGPTGGVVSSGYNSTAGYISGSAAFEEYISSGFQTLNNTGYGAATAFSGVLRLSRWDTSEHLWLMTAIFDFGSTGAISTAVGSITLAGELNDITLTTTGGTAAFDAGEARYRYR